MTILYFLPCEGFHSHRTPPNDPEHNSGLIQKHPAGNALRHHHHDQRCHRGRFYAELYSVEEELRW